MGLTSLRMATWLPSGTAGKDIQFPIFRAWNDQTRTGCHGIPLDSLSAGSLVRQPFSFPHRRHSKVLPHTGQHCGSLSPVCRNRPECLECFDRTLHKMDCVEPGADVLMFRDTENQYQYKFEDSG